MKSKALKALMVGSLLTPLAIPAVAQQTPGGLVESYDALAETLLGARRLEAGLVHAILDAHRRAAEAHFERGEIERAAAEMTLFAREGGDAVAGVRKRLLDEGHRYHADSATADRYEPGFVIVTREAKAQILGSAAALREATTEAARDQAWKGFAATAERLLIAD